MPRSLVIGGNGFLGSHLVDELAALGHEVTAFDRFSADSTSYAATGVRRIVGDFLNRADVADAVAGQDNVWHFLSTTTPASAENDPELDVRTNVTASIALFELAARAGVEKLYFASTGGAIYGDQPHASIAEEVLPQPISPYAIGKLAIEGYLRYFERKQGLQSVSFRISNPYGPRQRSNKKQGVIPIFLQRVADGLPLTVFGDGSMVRDFIYVEDAARRMASVAGKPTAHSLYNIGSGNGTSVSAVIDVVREVTGRDVSIESHPQPSTFVVHSVLDSSRFDSEFDSAAILPLGEGIRRTWLDTIGKNE